MRWTKDKIDKLREMYVDTGIHEICKYFNATKSQIYCAAQTNGIKRSKEWMYKKVYVVKPNIPTQFKVGHESWNKGKKMPKGWGGNTSFKKGHKPHNWKPEGTERINRDGYIEIKRNGKYRPKQRVLYEEYHGVKVPNMDLVIFEDGDRNNFAIENLKVITRQEHMNRNHWINLPKEVQEVIHLKKTITKLITEHGKKQN